MEINVIRLRTVLDGREEIIKNENTNFLEEINNELMNDDLLFREGSKTASSSVVFVETGGSETKFLPYFESLESPIILLSNGKNNSLPAAFEIKTYCAMHGKLAIVVTGEETRCAEMLVKFARINNARHAFKGNILGVIGEPSEWLISSRVNYSDVENIFDIKLVDIKMDELIKEIDKKESGKVPHLADLKKKFKNQEVLDGACYIYGALKRLIDKYHLNGLTIRCFDLLGKYKNTACLALALLNEEGITSACEGDVPALITMHILRALTGRSAFQANPSFIDSENKTVLFAHCTLPLNMVSKYELLTHFESNLGIGIKGEMALGQVSICKLFINEKHNLDNCLIIGGTIKENCSLPGYCRTQIKVELSDYDLMTLLNENFGNHVIITYGDVVNDLYSLVSILSFEKHLIKE